MSNSYLLPCDCGKSIAVETSQAGQTIRCPACQRQQTVPTLRAIRQLPRAQESSAPRTATQRRESTWSPLKGMLFASGIMLGIVGTIVAAHSYIIYAQVAAFQPSTAEYDTSLEAIDNMTTADMHETWHFIKQHGLEEAGTNPFAIARQVANEKRRLVIVGCALIVIGLLVAVTPLVMRGRSPR